MIRNLNMLKLVIAMQLQAESIHKQASEMADALTGIIQEIERMNAEPPPAPIAEQPVSTGTRKYRMSKLAKAGRKVSIEAARAKLDSIRDTPEYRAKLSAIQRAYWESPAGQARKAKGKAAVFGGGTEET